LKLSSDLSPLEGNNKDGRIKKIYSYAQRGPHISMAQRHVIQKTLQEIQKKKKSPKISIPSQVIQLESKIYTRNRSFEKS